jgi:hypothetical protein
LRKIFNKRFVLSIFVLLILSCDYKPSSFGSFQKIVVFADSSLYLAVQTEMEQTFDQYIYTPHSEKSYYLDLQPLQAFDTYKTRRNILFAGLINGEDQVSEFITKSLSTNVKTSILKSQLFEIFKPDLFSTDQIVLFLSAKDLNTLKSNLASSGERIYEQMNKFYYERLEKAMFLKGEQIMLEDYLAEEFGWKIRIQHDYELVQEEKSGDFAWFRRLNPDRSLFVHRYKANSMPEQGDFLINLRDSIATAIFEGDSVDRTDCYFQNVHISGRTAIKLTGIWQNSKHLLGGPFRTYAFFDDKSKYIYVIDLSVTAPGQNKKPFLDQLEVLAKSITLINKG